MGWIVVGYFQARGTGRAPRGRAELGIGKRTVSWTYVERECRSNKDMKPK